VRSNQCCFQSEISSSRTTSRLWNWFITVDEDRSGQITATELQRALVNGNWSAFDLDTTKMLMGIFVSYILLSPLPYVCLGVS
jgi:hypothetical protein